MAGNDDDFTYIVLKPPFMYAPIKEGEELASLRIYYSGQEVDTIPLYAAENVETVPEKTNSENTKKAKKGLFTRIKEFFGRVFSN